MPAMQKRPYLSKRIWHSLKSTKIYIDKLNAAGKLIAGQPIVREGEVIFGKEGHWASIFIHSTKEVQVSFTI